MSVQLAEFSELGLRILGLSLAGEETCIVAPEMNFGLDVGRAPRELLAVDHVFLSHGHMDHSAGIAYYFAQRLFIDNAPGTLYVPRPLVQPVRRLLRAWAEIDGNEPPANIVGLEPGQDVALRRDLVMRPFRVNHPCRRSDGSVIDSLGYCAIEVRQKLKPEHQDLTGPQLVELKKRGVEITRRVEIPLVCYCGDTAPGEFLSLPFVREARVLLLECTFFEPDHVGRARAGNHIHVRDLREILPNLANERIILTHLSRRTSLADAKAHTARELGPQLAERVRFLADYRRRRSSPRRAAERDAREIAPND